MSARDDARGGAWFVAAGLCAGLGHYLFQVLATLRLDPAHFAAFSAWLAHLAAAFVAAGVTQYLANFHPVGGRRLTRALIGVNALALAAAAVILVSEDPFGLATGAAVLVLATGLGWTLGQLQIRLDYFGLAGAQIANAGVKLGVPLLAGAGPAIFARAVGLAFLPALWFAGARLRRRSVAPAAVTPSRRGWIAPVTLAVAANVLPQFDLIALEHAVGPEDFSEFARASLFYKGIYFVTFVFAQWLLPRQIRGGVKLSRALGPVAAFAGAAAIGLTFLSPYVSDLVLHWDHAPPRGLIFGSCLHMGLLTLIFLIVQDACARNRPGRAAGLLVALALEAAVAVATGPTPSVYLIAAVVAQTALVLAALRLTSVPPA